MKRKKKNKLWMLQAVLCAVCILSAALIYHDYVAIPRQNRELVEELKTCFPEDIPPGGGSPGEKEEQAGREPEVSAVDLQSLQHRYPGVRGWLTIPEVGIDYPVMQSSREEPEYYLNSGAMFGNLDRYAAYDYWKAHPRVFFQTPEGMEEYQIAAVLKADVSMFDFQQASFHIPKELEAYVAQAKALSLFETGVAGAGCETTLTLVTCSYEWKEARNILVAVKAEPER